MLDPIPIDWRDGAACADSDPAIWFPESGSDTTNEREAQRWCRTCPVRVTCLEASLDYGRDTAGIWGGLGSAKRRHLRQARSRQHREGYPTHRFTPGCSCSFCQLVSGYLHGMVIDRNTGGARCGYRSSYGRNCRCCACTFAAALHTRRENAIAA